MRCDAGADADADAGTDTDAMQMQMQMQMLPKLLPKFECLIFVLVCL